MTSASSSALEDAINLITEGLSNPQYFQSTKPSLYNHLEYITSCGQNTSRKRLENEWYNVLIPRLKASSVEVLRRTGKRLQKEWIAIKEARRDERAEDDDSIKMRKLLKRSLHDHRKATLGYSGDTLKSDFDALGPSHALPSSSSRQTPPYQAQSSSPEQSTLSPPLPPQFLSRDEIVEQEIHDFFTSTGSLQDILLSKLRDGNDMPLWAKDRPLYTFELRLRHDWGPRVTELYEAAKAKPFLITPISTRL
ncbi:hypothetical protein BGZ51_003919, partial [Haplosporangium sp. Z 767]